MIENEIFKNHLILNSLFHIFYLKWYFSSLCLCSSYFVYNFSGSIMTTMEELEKELSKSAQILGDLNIELSKVNVRKCSTTNRTTNSVSRLWDSRNASRRKYRLSEIETHTRTGDFWQKYHSRETRRCRKEKGNRRNQSTSFVNAVSETKRNRKQNWGHCNDRGNPSSRVPQ